MTDKGIADAVRLAANLRMNIIPLTSMNGRNVGWGCYPVGRGDCMMEVDGNDAVSLCKAIMLSAKELEISKNQE